MPDEIPSPKLLTKAIARKLSIGVATLGMALGTFSVTTAPANAQSCRSSSYIPGLSPMTLQHASGNTVSLQRDSRNYKPTAHVWINGNYTGQYDIPFSLYGNIYAQLRMGQRLETWMGSVRQAYKATPYVTVCGNWSGNLP